MKKCPFCAEEIQDEAIKCRHCGEFLDKNVPGKTKNPWYFRKSSLVLSFLFVGPFMLPLVWTHPQFSRTKKIVLTVMIIAITIILAKLMADTLKRFQQSFEEMQKVLG